MDIVEKKKVSRVEIARFLVDYFRGRAVASLVTGTLLTVCFTICGALSESRIMVRLGSAMAFSCFFVFGFMAVRAFLNLRKTKKLDFYITSDLCTNKQVAKEDGFSTGKRYLFFAEHKKYYIDFQHRGVFAAQTSATDLYDSVYIGDSCYIVGFEKESTPYMVLPQRYYSIPEGEFEARGRAYYPIKDVDADTLLRK